MNEISPSAEQHAIIQYPLMPLRVDAGAGTGKTTTMALRLAHLLNTGRVDAALGITFTNKASQELQERIEQLRPTRDEGVVDVTTYHGFAHGLLAEFGAYVGVERNTRLITPGFVRQLMHDALGAGTYAALDLAAPGYRVEEMAALNGQLADNLRAADSVAPGPGEVGDKRAELLQALGRYELLKRQTGVVDYGDLIRLAHRLLAEAPAAVAQLRDRYQVVLLDEYQDTNPAQRELLRLVFGKGFAVTAVGDADQTIYEWRGASLENFAQFPVHFPASDGSPAATLPLTLNRRSDTRILEAANAIAARIGDRAGDHTLHPQAGAEPGEVGVGWFRTAADEAQWVADTVLQANLDETPWGNIAVVFRKNAQIPLIRNVLASAGIPVQVVSLGGLLHVPEVTDLWAWLRILNDPSDGAALLRVLLGAHFQLGLGDLVPLAEWVRQEDSAIDTDDPEMPGFSLLEAAFEVPVLERSSATAKLDLFRSLYTQLVEDAQGVTLVELCRRVLANLGVWIEVDALEEAAARSARLNLYRFLDLAESWSPLEGRPSLSAFLDYLSTLMDESAPAELDLARVAQADAVTLITAHRAKGLEWDLVFLPAVVADTFPARSQGFDDPFSRPGVLPFAERIDAASLPDLDPADEKDRKDALRLRHWDQEWRTAYVSATRARHRLLVSGAYWYGQKKPKNPSQLFELVAGLPGVVDHAGREEPGDRPPAVTMPTPGPSPDPHFAGGWEEALRAAIADPNWPRNQAMDASAYDDHVDQLSLILDNLPEPEADGRDDSVPTTSVSSLVTYATCPKRYFWTDVDRLPRRPAPWLKRGVALHRKIELHNRGVVPLDLVQHDTYDFAPDEADPREDAYATFEASRFAASKPRWTEAPFLIGTKEARIRGRIDAVYEADGGWEVVDFKSGRSRPDPARIVQLQAYAVAVADGGLGVAPPDDVTVTFAYFGDGLEEMSERVDPAWLESARADIKALLVGIQNEQFEPSPSVACHHCDFAKFCDAGQTWLAENP